MRNKDRCLSARSTACGWERKCQTAAEMSRIFPPSAVLVRESSAYVSGLLGHKNGQYNFMCFFFHNMKKAFLTPLTKSVMPQQQVSLGGYMFKTVILKTIRFKKKKAEQRFFFFLFPGKPCSDTQIPICYLGLKPGEHSAFYSAAVQEEPCSVCSIRNADRSCRHFGPWMHTIL